MDGGTFEERWADAGRDIAKGSAAEADCVFCILGKPRRFQRPSRTSPRNLCADHRLEADLEMIYLRGASDMFWSAVGPGIFLALMLYQSGRAALLPALPIAVVGGAWRYYLARCGSGRLRYGFGSPRPYSWGERWNQLPERGDQTGP